MRGGTRMTGDMPFELNALETRILGCLLEKERFAPENYPLSLNGLTIACNQSTNRDPVTNYDERTVESGLDSLREKKLATLVHTAGARVPKYRHKLPEHFDLDSAETAILCVLLLRGAQTAGELRQRCERMHPFTGLDAVEQCLAGLEKEDRGLVSQLPQRPGQKERRFIQRLSSAATLAEPAGETIEAASIPALPLAERVAALEALTSELQTEIQRLRAELETFRKQFE
jgi:uncharacterized protein YceH (UPF0502 family)